MTLAIERWKSDRKWIWNEDIPILNSGVDDLESVFKVVDLPSIGVYDAFNPSVGGKLIPACSVADKISNGTKVWSRSLGNGMVASLVGLSRFKVRFFATDERTVFDRHSLPANLYVIK